MDDNNNNKEKITTLQDAYQADEGGLVVHFVVKFEQLVSRVVEQQLPNSVVPIEAVAQDGVLQRVAVHQREALLNLD